MLRFLLTLLVAAALAQFVLLSIRQIEVVPVVSAVINFEMCLAAILAYAAAARIQDPQRFTQVYILSIVMKMLLACATIIVLILLDQPHARTNVLFLFTLYVLYTSIEVFFLSALTRARRGAKKNQKISF